MANILLSLANSLRQKYLIKLSFIRKMPGGRYRVVSKKGKNLGEYDTREEAVKRLRQVEFFKHKKATKVIDLSALKELTYSAVMRELRKQCNEETVFHFMQVFKKVFDSLLLMGNQAPDKEAMSVSLSLFSKEHEMELPDA